MEYKSKRAKINLNSLRGCNRDKVIVNEIMVQNSPNLMKDSKSQTCKDTKHILPKQNKEEWDLLPDNIS